MVGAAKSSHQRCDGLLEVRMEIAMLNYLEVSKHRGGTDHALSFVEMVSGNPQSSMIDETPRVQNFKQKVLFL